MGKADQKRTQNEITRTVDQNQANSNAGISDTGQRVANLTTRSDAERGAINQNYTGWIDNGGITDEEVNRLRSGGNRDGNGGGDGEAPEGNGGGGNSGPSYLDVWREMQGKTGGFDETRLNNINSSSERLRNSQNNYGSTDTSISGLQDFARTGGIQSDTLSRIYDPTLTEFATTGGYTDADKANIRNRSNAGVSSFYNNLREGMDRSRLASGANINGGAVAGTNLKLARASAQDQAGNLRNTELGINDSVRAGRMAAASKLSDAGLGVAGIQSNNTLQGYDKAGQLDLTKQKQVADALAASGNLDLGTQSTINNARLAATSGLSQDTLGRMSIGASQAAANAALAAANERFIIGQRQQGRFEANQGLLDTYRSAPAELMHEEDLLRDYRNDQAAQNFQTINARTNASQIPGLGSTISSGLNIGGQILGMAGGGMGGFSGFGGGNSGISGGMDLAVNPYGPGF